MKSNQGMRVSSKGGVGWGSGCGGRGEGEGVGVSKRDAPSFYPLLR